MDMMNTKERVQDIEQGILSSGDIYGGRLFFVFDLIYRSYI